MVFSEGAAQSTNRQQFKHNRVNYLESIVPDLYLEDDIAASSVYIGLEDQIINTHITFAANINRFFPISSTNTYPSMDNVSGISPFFCKQTELTHISPFEFERDIMSPLGRSMSEFTTSADFQTFLTSELQPRIKLNGITSSLGHNDLLSHLGWFYILNVSGSPFSPSTYVTQQLNRLFIGETLETVDGINGVTETLWRNYSTCSLISNLKLIPPIFLSSTSFYGSGTQQLESLKTLNSVIYSPLDIDVEDYKVETAFHDYIFSGLYLKNLESAGPFRRLMKALSYSIHDVDDQIETLKLIYNIHSCPDKYLPYVAELIGWTLVGHNPDRWRLQLRNAVDIYKATGTKQGLTMAVDSMFTDNVFDLSSNVVELYESYIPYLLYYSLNTATPIFSSFDSWTKSVATNFGVSDYSPSNMDTNIRYVVDYILYKTILTYPTFFRYGGLEFPIGDPNFQFYYRDRVYPIPPWEDIEYYKTSELNQNLLDNLGFELQALGVPAPFVNLFKHYTGTYTLSSTNDLLMSNNSWLFFTSSLQFAPNYQEIMNNFQGTKVKYLSLWNGKSSHFSLNFQASAFSFNKFSLDTSSSLAFIDALRMTNKFIPAHSIPNAKLILNTTDQASAIDNRCNILSPFVSDYLNSSGTLGSSLVVGFVASGVDMLRGAASAIFKKQAANDLADPAITFQASAIFKPRNSIRRRNYHNLIPRHYFFIRSGFSNIGPYEAPLE